MHLTIDARMYNSSGIGTYLKNIIPFIPTDIRLTLLGPSKLLSGLKDRAEIVEFDTDIYSIKEQLQYKKLIPECDIFWSPHYNVPLMPVKAKKRLITIHDVYHLAFINQLTFKQKIYARLVMNQAIKASDKIITVSNFSKKEIIKYTGCKNEKIAMIHNGIAINQHEPSLNTKQKYHLPDKYLLFIGNIKPHKNLVNLLKAYQLLNNDIKQQYNLVIAGKNEGFITGDTEVSLMLERYAELKNRVVFTGYVDDEDIGFIYKNASVFIFPSLYEGFGLPPLEAMANGCPTAVSSTEIMHEVCGDATLYFDPVNAEDISAKITQLLKDKSLVTMLLNRGNEQVKNFTWAHAASKHLDILYELNNNTK